jgi:hypothetical protein
MRSIEAPVVGKRDYPFPVMKPTLAGFRGGHIRPFVDKSLTGAPPRHCCRAVAFGE